MEATIVSPQTTLSPDRSRQRAIQHGTAPGKAHLKKYTFTMGKLPAPSIPPLHLDFEKILQTGEPTNQWATSAVDPFAGLYPAHTNASSS
jgi:hypothetical protein